MKPRSYKYPAPLLPGATIAVFSASAPEAAKNPDVINRGITWLKSEGFNIVEAPSLRKNAGWLSATPQRIATELASLVRDPHVDAIFCAGGGMNGNEVLPFIDYSLFAKHPKPILRSF